MAGALAGRTAVITGASRGIGRACAAALAAEGARVALLARSADALQHLAGALGAGAIAVPCDLSQAAAVDGALQAIQAAFGAAPDILVNNAGAFLVAPAEQIAPDYFERALAVNLVAPFRFVHTLLPGMRARGTGHVVTIGSVADHLAFPGNTAYAAGKYGLRGLHEVLRVELRGSGVRTTLVSPGPVDTDLWSTANLAARGDVPDRARMLDAAAVADAVRFAVTRPAPVNVDELRLSRS